MKHTFITFEGGEGAGKTTQIRMLAAALRSRGYEVYSTREPGDAAGIGVALRSILKDCEEPICGKAEVFMFMADRAQHEGQILYALARGMVVLCDRFKDSSVVYQGVVRGAMDPTVIGMLNEIACGVNPDKTILLDVDPEIGLGRQADVGRFEAESMEFHRAVRQGFFNMAVSEPARWAVIDGHGTVEEVHAAVLNALGLLS